MPFQTTTLSDTPDATAPDGSEVRLLPATKAGSMAHFSLAPGSVTRAVRHRTVEELWYVLAGAGEIWRRLGADEEVVRLFPGVGISIPVGAAFQFRSTGDVPLQIVDVTMPPWPGDGEVEFVDGIWTPTD